MGASLVADMISTAALLNGDPNQERIKPDQWLSVYNLACGQMCRRFRILKAEWKDDLATTNVYCTYPDDMTVLTGVAVYENADDITTRRNLVPFENEDAFRTATYNTYIDESIPTRYYADPEVIYLYGKPSLFVTDGLRLEGFALPVKVATTAGAVYEPPELTVDLCLRRMAIICKRINKQYAEADAEEKAWLEDGMMYAQQIEARGAEQKTVVRPANWQRPFGMMT